MKKILLVILVFIFSTISLIAQCSITTNTNASSLTCGTAPLSGCGGILYIGDGVNPMTLSMNANLDLTCAALSPIRLIVRNNATLDFAPFNGANFDLSLSAGSSIEFEAGSVLNGGNSGSCSNSDRITIGGVVVATCQGGGTPLSFDEIYAAGGSSPFTISASPSSGCGPLASTITVVPNTVTGATVKWYTVASGGTAVATDASSPFTYTPTVSSTTTYYAEVAYSGYTTVRKPVTVTITPNNTVGAASSSPTVCVNTAIPSVTHTTTGATGIGVASNLPTGVSASWAANTITISGTPTVSGTFNYSIPLTGGCGSVSATGTITVTANNTVAAASSNPTVCVNTAIPTVTHTTTGATGIGVASNLPTGVIASWAANTITISGIPTVSGTFNYSIPLTGGCGSVSATGTITVYSAVSAPSIGVVVQPNCLVATGTVTLNGLPAVGSWTVNPGAIVGSGTTTVISGLSAGSYNFTVTDANGCVSPASNVVLNAVQTNTWNGSAWSLGSAPTISQSVVITGNYNTSLGNFSSCSLQINPGVTVTVNANQYIEVDNAIVNNGTLFIDDDGSLIQNNNAAVNSGTGTNTMMRKPVGLKLFDYVYWSSPLMTTPFSMIPNSRYYEWVSDYANPVGYGYGNWIVPTGSNMTAGKGYIFRVPSNLNQDVTFTGSQFNNGSILATIKKGPYTSVFLPPPGINGTITIYDDNYNLIGNPYPSSIDAIQFVTDNSAVLEDGTVSLWRHSSAISNTNSSPYYQSFTYNYSASDYVTYNALGSNPPGAFNGKIASGQGFFVVMKDNVAVPSTSNVVFNNGQRSRTYDNSQFFRTTGIQKAAVIEKHRIWLDLIDSNKMATGQLIGYSNGATNGVDFLYDSRESLARGFKFYSIVEGEKFKIQGRELPFDQEDRVTLGLTVPKDGTYTIGINAVDGRFAEDVNKIYLEDRKLGVIQDLKTAPYSFTISKGNTTDRFVLRYMNPKLESSSASKIANTLRVSIHENTIELNSEVFVIHAVTVYNVLGQEVYSNRKVDAKNCSISTFENKNQVLIIKGQYEDGTNFVHKVTR